MSRNTQDVHSKHSDDIVTFDLDTLLPNPTTFRGETPPIVSPSNDNTGVIKQPLAPTIALMKANIIGLAMAKIESAINNPTNIQQQLDIRDLKDLTDIVTKIEASQEEETETIDDLAEYYGIEIEV